MKRSLLLRLSAIVIVCVAFLAVVAPVLADWEWCIIDPHVTVGGHQLQLEALVGAQGQLDQIGNAQFVLAVPPGVPASVTYLDPGTQCRIVVDPRLQVGPDGSIPVWSAVFVLTRTQHPVMFNVLADGQLAAQAQGTTGTFICTSLVLQ
jgi:hypothetical protein